MKHIFEKIYWQVISLVILIFIFQNCSSDYPNLSISNNYELDPSGPIDKYIYYYTYLEHKPNFSIHYPDTSFLVPLPENEKNAPLNDKIINLGRVLFYDYNLSINGKVSCASCHQQSKAFADGIALSSGYDNKPTSRNSMSIQNMNYLGHYRWDSETDNLIDLVRKPLTHPVEMGNPNLESMIERIKSISHIKSSYQIAYGNVDIIEIGIVQALAQFVASIYSSNSKYDIELKNNFNNFSVNEKLGMKLFNGKAKCNQCHTPPTFAAPDHKHGKFFSRRGLANNGIDQKNSFKVPTLRNLEFTAPYMHLGNYKNLDEVINYYDSGINYNANLDSVLVDKKSPVKSAIKLNLSAAEKEALKSFLLTLSDAELLTTKRYSNPFY